MEHLTVGDVRSLRILSSRFMARAKSNLLVKIEDREQNIRDAQSEALAQLETVKPSKRDPDSKGFFGKIRDWHADQGTFCHRVEAKV